MTKLVRRAVAALTAAAAPATVAAAVVLASLALAAAPGAARPICAVADGDFHVALVIQGRNTAHSLCVAFNATTPTFDAGNRSISGDEVLLLSKVRYQAVDYGGSLGLGLCQVDDEPATPSGGFTTGNCYQGGKFWLVRQASGGAWMSAGSGISNLRLADGGAEGLSYGGAPLQDPHGLCPPAQPWPAPSSTAPATGGPPVGGGYAPGLAGTAPGATAGSVSPTDATPGTETTPSPRAAANPEGPGGPAGPGERPVSGLGLGLGAALASAFARVGDMWSAWGGWVAAVSALLGLTALLLVKVSDTGEPLNPRAVAAWSGAGLLIVVLTNNPAYRGIVLLAALNLLVARRRPESRLRPVLMFLAMATAISTAVSLALSHTGQHVLLSLPSGIPVLGGILTLESAVFGVGAGLGIAAAALAMAPLSMVLDAHQLVEALPAQLHRTGTMLAAALNLAPGIGRSAVAVREAQTLRGWRPRGARSYADILVPVTLTALENSIQVAEAMDARGYGSGPRTRMSAPRWTLSDKLALAAAAVAATAVLAGRLLGLVSDWWPYPALALPSVNAAMVLASALLVLPALGRRHD